MASELAKLSSNHKILSDVQNSPLIQKGSSIDTSKQNSSKASIRKKLNSNYIITKYTIKVNWENKKTFINFKQRF